MLRTSRVLCTAGPRPTTLAARFDAYKRLIRFDKQIGTWLLLLPSWWGHGAGYGMQVAAAAAKAKAPLSLGAAAAMLPLDVMATFGVGALCMRSAGCIVNDMWDKDFDSRVERTKLRPIAAGEVTMGEAFGYLTAHMTVGLGVLLCLHPHAVYVGALSVPFVVMYPAMKRVTNLPQLFLGVTFNWGVMVGAASVCGSVNWAVVAPMYLAGISWTMLYDTVYAHQDKEDDIKIGVKSSALFFGDSKTPLHAFCGATTSLLMVAGYTSGAHAVYYPAVGAAGLFLNNSLKRTDLASPPSCGKFFLANKHYGLMITAAVFASVVLNVLLGTVGAKDAADEEESDAPEEPTGTMHGLGGNLYFAHNIALVGQVVRGERAVGWDLLKA